jgi:UDP:flavonoid glycosyltransferase YjiC (YdhE family)
MRIAFAVEGTRGDVHPMLALGDRLRARGHEIVVCAPPDFQADAEAHGFEFHAVGRSARETLAEQAAAVVRGGLPMLRAANGYIEGALRAQFATLPDATAGAGLIIGAGVQVAAASVAERHGVPYRYVAYVPTLLPSSEHAPCLLPLPRLPRWVNRLLWWLLERVYSAMLRGTINRERAALGLGPIRNVLAHFVTDSPLLAADPELAPAPADFYLRTTVIGCLHALEGGELPPKLASFLDAGPPPVYLGFGSMTDTDPAGTTRLILRAIERVGCRALVSEGWAGLAQQALPEGVLAIGSVSHARLFPRLAAVVHHGGAGTTTTAARAGVPQIVVPHLFDQIYWGERVAALGLGPPPIRRTRLSEERLAAALREALENEVIQERARELGVRLRDRLARDGDPAQHFEID